MPSSSQGFRSQALSLTKTGRTCEVFPGPLVFVLSSVPTTPLARLSREEGSSV